MNVHSKNGVRTIKLDKTEQRTIGRFLDLMRELAIFNTALEMTVADIRDNVSNRIDAAGVFDAAPPKGTK